MREIKVVDIGDALRKLLEQDNPLDKDIGIFDVKGQLKGVVIPADAYEFFLRKVEEEEGRADVESVEEFNQSGEKGK